MEIKTVAVLGAGAVGSYIIWGLDKKVKLLAKGNVLNVYKRDV